MTPHVSPVTQRAQSPKVYAKRSIAKFVKRIMYTCPYCLKKYEEAKELIKHLEIHEDESENESEDSFKLDLRKCEDGGKPFKCKRCPFSSKFLKNLQSHMKLHKMSGRPYYKCSFCSFTSRAYYDWRKHEALRHKEEMAYALKPCQVVLTRCDHLFKKYGLSSRKTFTSTPHTIQKTSTGKYKCSQCPASLATLSGLQRHLLIHSGKKPHRCTWCPKAFYTSDSLRTHELIHLGLKPFPCPKCSKPFRQKGHLEIHMRSHTGEKPYKCVWCGKFYSQKSVLNLHVKKQHPKK